MFRKQVILMVAALVAGSALLALGQCPNCRGGGGGVISGRYNGGFGGFVQQRIVVPQGFDNQPLQPLQLPPAATVTRIITPVQPSTVVRPMQPEKPAPVKARPNKLQEPPMVAEVKAKPELKVDPAVAAFSAAPVRAHPSKDVVLATAVSALGKSR